MENCKNKYADTFRLMIENSRILKDIKTLTVKEIQQKIFPDNITYVYDHIWKSKYTRHRAINYQTAYGLLPIIGKQNCPFCNRHTETMKHILLDCGKLTKIRCEITRWLKAINPNIKLDESLILIGKNIENDIERYIISEYKIAIWIIRNKVKFENAALKIQEVINKIESNVRFYLKHRKVLR